MDFKWTIGETIAAVERRMIDATLEHHGGNKSKTARTLGISLKTLYNRLNQYERDRIASAIGVDLAAIKNENVIERDRAAIE